MHLFVTGQQKWTKLAQNTPDCKMLSILGSVYIKFSRYREKLWHLSKVMSVIQVFLWLYSKGTYYLSWLGLSLRNANNYNKKYV